MNKTLHLSLCDNTFHYHLQVKIIEFLNTFLSKKTQNSYLSDLKFFFGFLKNHLSIEIQDVSQINERMVILWKNSLHKNSPVTIARKLSTLSSFLNYCFRHKYIKKNIMKFVHKPRITKEGKTAALTHQEVNDFLNFCAIKRKENISNKRYYAVWSLHFAVFCTLFSVGMRVDELCQLKIKDLIQDGDNWKLNLLRKGGRPQVLFIHPDTAEVLLNYKGEWRGNAKADDSFFVRSQVSKKLTKLNSSSVYRMMIHCAKQSGIPKKVTPHSCRTTLATLLHLQGTPVVQIQNLLNHKLVTSTAVYLRTSAEAMKDAVNHIDFLD